MRKTRENQYSTELFTEIDKASSARMLNKLSKLRKKRSGEPYDTPVSGDVIANIRRQPEHLLKETLKSRLWSI